MPSSHSWLFFRTGGLDQAALKTADDLRNLATLDPKLWVALACPVQGLEIDEKTLKLIDTDGDGRIRVPEVLAAVDWAVRHLKDPSVIYARNDSLPLAAIDDSNADGAAVLANARRVLANLGKPSADAVSVADTGDTARIFAQTAFNGDGVVPVDCTEDAAVKAVIEEIIGAVGSVIDRSGKPGIDAGKVDAFFGQLAAYEAWWKQGEESSTKGGGVLPLGDKTPAAAAALAAVRAKIDDFFHRVRLASFDARATAAMNRGEGEYAALAPKDLSAAQDEVAALPLARIEAGRALPLGDGLNPAWVARIAAFKAAAVEPVLGKDTASLTEEGWAKVKSTLAAFEQWQACKSVLGVEKLGIARVREILASNTKAAIGELIAKDLALAPEVAAIDRVDRLVRYARDLSTLLHNFVNFGDFYSRDVTPIFQAGTLYFDGRATELCLRVGDAGKHGSMAPASKIYLAYCDCTRKDGAKMTIAAAFTAGDADNLAVGRNGIFFDRAGRDWDATITKVIENPISIREAFWMPYKRVGALINSQIERIASAREKEAQGKLAAGVESAATRVEKPGAAPAPAPAQGGGVAQMAGILAAVGLALGAIGTALATAFAAFMGLVWWQMPLAILGIMLLISGPSCILAWLKLRQRTLGPLLDANGWAINGRVKITFPLGRVLTDLRALPVNSTRSLDDPYAEKQIPWVRYVLLLLVVVAAVIATAWYKPDLFARIFGS